MSKQKTGPKFTAQELAEIKQKYYDGYKDQQIVDFCKEEFDKTIVYQTAKYYRKKWAEEILAHQDEVIKEVKTVGYCLISQRIKAIESLIDRQIQEFHSDKGKYGSNHSRIIADLQKTIAMLQSHLKENDGFTIETAGGTKIITSIVEIPTISENDPLNEND